MRTCARRSRVWPVRLDPCSSSASAAGPALDFKEAIASTGPDIDDGFVVAS
jgi:hypothetical protein